MFFHELQKTFFVIFADMVGEIVKKRVALEATHQGVRNGIDEGREGERFRRFLDAEPRPGGEVTG